MMASTVAVAPALVSSVQMVWGWLCLYRGSILLAPSTTVLYCALGGDIRSCCSQTATDNHSKNVQLGRPVGLPGFSHQDFCVCSAPAVVAQYTHDICTRVM